MVRFSELRPGPDGRPVEVNVREIPRAAMLKCPHCIMVAAHYREDNTCRCDDPDHTEMKEWGYKWSKRRRTWL